MIIDGEAYPMETDYRAGIAYATELMRGKSTSYRLLALWFPDRIPENISAAQEAINGFFLCGAEPDDKQERNSPPPYAYTTDGDAITAAFQREYHIDLTADPLHWWRFSALLRGLLTHSFGEKVRYRITDPSTIKSKDMRGDYTKYKRMYALDMNGEPVKEPDTLEDYNAMLLKIARGE